MKLQAIAIMTFLTFMNVMAQETTKSTDMNTLELTQEWDKTFPQSDKVEHTKITFHNRMASRLPQTSINQRMHRDTWLPLLSAVLTGL